MKGVIIGGGTFLGYWLKRKIIVNGNERPIIIDLPRNSINVYVSTKDVFYPLQEINYEEIRDYRPKYVLFNYYDLFDVGSLTLNNTGNNFIMAATNKLLDMAEELSCFIFVLTHINRYPEIENSYQSAFNSLNDLYLQYIELIAKAKRLKTRIFLLPNLFGPREPSLGVIPTILRKVKAGDRLELARTERDFMCVHSVVEYANKLMFNYEEDSTNEIVYYYLSSGNETSLLEMYNIICSVIGKKTEIYLVNDTYKLTKTQVDGSKIEKLIIPQDYFMSITHYNRQRI
jgi:hypothetical protein